MTRGSERGERGNAVLVGIVLVGVLTFVALLTSTVGGVLADQRRVESAADLAALAGASALQSGGNGCAAARTVARSNGGRMVSCTVTGDELLVRVARSMRVVLGRRITVHGDARAGPGPVPGTARTGLVA